MTSLSLNISCEFKKLLKGLAGLSVLVLTTVGLLFITLPRNSMSYYHGVKLKDDLLKKTRSPKLILAGASNLAFGVDSRALSRALGMDVVNMGLHGGLGLSLVINAVAGAGLNDGDVVVFALEYGHFHHVNYRGNVSVCELLLEDPSASRHLGAEHLSVLVETGGRVLGKRLVSTIFGDVDASNPVYNSCAFNEYGDVVSHLEDKQSALKDSFSAPAVLMTISPVLPSSPAIKKLRQFIYQAESRGANVYFLPPCLRNTEYQAYREKINSSYAMLISHFPGKVLAHPDDFAFEARHCFDTEYHLNCTGRAIRTARMIRWLKPIIKQNSGAVKL